MTEPGDAEAPAEGPAPLAMSPLRGFGGDGDSAVATEEDPMTLSDTALVMLAAAAQRADRGIERLQN